MEMEIAPESESVYSFPHGFEAFEKQAEMLPYSHCVHILQMCKSFTMILIIGTLDEHMTVVVQVFDVLLKAGPTLNICNASLYSLR